jgi:hypothetical protein
MNEKLEILLSIISGGGGGALITTYLTDRIKAKIKLDFDLKFAEATSNLKHDYDLKFELAKSELEKKATEHQVQYSKLHIERSERLKDIYLKMLECERALENLTTLGQGPDWIKDDAREEIARATLNELKLLVLQNRIYFRVEICQRLDRLIATVDDVIRKMSEAKFLADQENRTRQRVEDAISPHKIWFEQRDRVSNDVALARILIEDEFRSMLGV